MAKHTNKHRKPKLTRAQRRHGQFATWTKPRQGILAGDTNWGKRLEIVNKQIRRQNPEGTVYEARPDETYRGARRNKDRLSARCKALKEERLLLGITRRELDRMRHARWQLIKLAESNRALDPALEAASKKMGEIAA